MGHTSVIVEEKDMGWKRIKRETKKFQNSATYIGYFSNGAGGPDSNVAARALINETGYITKRGGSVHKVTGRPFMKRTFSTNKKKINQRIDVEYNNVLKGKYTAKQAISRIGAWYVGRTKVMIKTGSFAPNKPATIREKGSSKPLIDTGEMWRATTHREKMG